MTAPIPDAAALQEAIARILCADPICNGRVCSDSVEAIAAVVVEACAGHLEGTAEIARMGGVNGNCDPNEALLLDTALSAEASAIRKLAQPLQGEVG